MSDARPIDRLLEGSVDCVQRDELERKLSLGRPLVVKAGFDPSAPDIHLGHCVLLGKMRQFQDMGHEVVFVVGDFTAQIGDPSGRSRTRPALTRDEIVTNAQTYRRQALKLLDADRTRLEYNASWLAELGAGGLIKLASRYTLARMLERDDFAKRFKAQQPIALHELLYPLAQAYDSVALKADVELGGTDQTFNLLVGRDIMREYGLEPQVVITTPLLVGIDGVEKMSKSLGNYVAIEDPPGEMYGKLMSVSDELMWSYYQLLLEDGKAQRLRLEAAVRAGEAHPMRVKQDLALELTRRFHGEQAASRAEQEFEQVFKERQRPSEVEEHRLPAGEPLSVAVLLADAALVPSRSEARSLIAQGGVVIDGVKLADPRAELQATAGRAYDLKVGKRRFLRVRFD